MTRQRQNRANALLAAFEASPIGMALHDRDARFVAINAALAEINGLAPEDHLGRTLEDVVPAIAALVSPVLHQVIQSREAIRDVPLSGQSPAHPGDERHWLASYVPIDLDGEPGVAVYVLDNTEERRLQQALQSSEEVFRQIAENVEAVLYLADPLSYHVHYLNPAFERVWGIPIAAVREAPDLWMDAIHRDDRDRVRAMLQSNRQTFRAEYRVVRPDGSIRWISDRSFPVTDASGKVVRIAGMATDDTERRLLESQLLQSQRMESIGRLAGGIAHDFNNLLTVILSHATFARQTPATAQEDLAAIERAGARASDLTRQLLAFARRQVIEPVVLDVNTLTLNIDKLLRRLIGENIELVTLLEPSLWRVRADVGQLEQVLVNLAVNARDAMPSGGKLTIETGNATLGAGYVAGHAEVVPGEYVMIAVSDTGGGIAPEVLPMIFEPFFTTKPGGQGTGLGLATCYGIVKQAGGHIWAYSELGNGASFKIYLPRAEGDLTELSSAAVLESPRGSETILVVEDDPSVRNIAVRTLRSLGFKVLEAASGMEALRVAAEYAGRIDLLLTDVVMPHMGGPELAKELSERRPGISILYTSGYTPNAIVHHGVLDKGLHFLSKPYVPAVLARKVRELLDA